jgi:hypothetical protein
MVADEMSFSGDKNQTYRIWLEEILPENRWQQRVAAGYYIFGGGRQNQPYYERSPDFNDHRMRFYDAHTAWLEVMDLKRVGIQARTVPSLTVTIRM